MHDGNWVGNREFTLGPMSLFSLWNPKMWMEKRETKHGQHCLLGTKYQDVLMPTPLFLVSVWRLLCFWLWLLKIIRGQRRVGQRWDAQISSSPLQTLGSRIITNFELLDGWLILDISDRDWKRDKKRKLDPPRVIVKLIFTEEGITTIWSCSGVAISLPLQLKFQSGTSDLWSETSSELQFPDPDGQGNLLRRSNRKEQNNGYSNLR